MDPDCIGGGATSDKSDKREKRDDKSFHLFLPGKDVSYFSVKVIAIASN